MDRGTDEIKEAMARATAVDDAPFELYGEEKPKRRRKGKSNVDDHIEQLTPDEDGAPPAGITPEEMDKARECAPLDQNDRDNARRWIIWFGERALYVSGMGWFTYDGRQWLRDEGDLHVRLLAQDLVDKIKLECAVIVPGPKVKVMIEMAEKVILEKPRDKWTAEDEKLVERAASAQLNLAERRAARKRFAVSTGNAGRTNALLQQAASYKAVPIERLDADRMSFNVLNGTLHFGRELDPERPEGSLRRLGKVDLRPHHRDDYITKCADVTFEREAGCPRFEEFLARVHPDAKMRLFLQVSHGYALLLGGNDEQRLIFHYGTGANGKSAFLEALGRMAATYRAVVAPESITGDGQREGNKANSDIARLFSARLVTIEELPRGVPLKESLIKALTGGTKMLARFLQKEFFEFEPVFTAVLSGNDMPTVSGTDYGIWRRLLIVHWGVTIPEGERTAPGELAAQFDAERAGILNWLIDGALLYLANGLTPYIPKGVTDFTDEYREERDPVGSFASSCLVSAEGYRLNASDLWKAYNDWCEANGIKAWNQTSFGNRLKALGYAKERGRLVQYVNVKLGDVPTRFDGPAAPPAAPGDPGWSTAL
jgi:putative DNA primase/helicase